MLTDAKIKAARPKAAAYKLGDAGQLYLFVTTAGGRHWRMNYSYGTNPAGRPAQKTLSLGSYPALTLADARAKRDEAKAVLREGRDPAVERRVAAKARAQSDGNTFEIVARRWYDLRQAGWSKVHARDVIDSLTNDLFPEIGDLPITAIGAPRLLEVLQRVEKRGAVETAHRLRQRVSAVFVYGIAAGLCDTDPAASLGKALRDKPRSKKQPSIIDGVREQDDRLAVIRKLLADCDAERCRASTKLGLRLIALTAVRPGELRFASWAEIEGVDWTTDAPAPAALWRIPAERMKGDEDRKAEEYGEHLVPLAPEAVDVLRAAWRLSAGLPYIFPSERHLHRPISENTLRALLIRAGYYQRHVPHGFRAAFSTFMNERADRAWREAGHKDASPDRAIIDLMLAHVPGNKVEGAYNRASYMPRRRELACEWAELVTEGLEAPATHLGKPIRYADTSPKAPRIARLTA
ncbi:MAG: tyrosine-type recombinase/integrase [Janthinobacterium lividum]